MDVHTRRKDKKYIYVIFLNSKECKTANIPFYVGQTSDLKISLSNHTEIDWHYAQFGTKCIVHVIASVPDTMADQAETETIAALVNLEFVLNNTIIDNSLKYIQGTDLHLYIDLMKKVIPSSLFKGMSKTWRVKESQLKSAMNNIMLDSGKRTSSELYRLVAQRAYPSNESRNLSKVLAKSYDANTGTAATTFFPSEIRSDHETVGLVRSTIKGLNGDWYFDGDYIRLGHPVFFHPSKGLLQGNFNSLSYGK